MTANQIDRNQRLKKQVPIDKKLRMAQYIRAENMDNRMKIRQRERLLYGTESPPLLLGKDEAMYMEEARRAGVDARSSMHADAVSPGVSGTFRLRMAAAIILFIGFLLCDAGEYKLFGYSMNDIYGMLSEDYFKLYDSENAGGFPELTELFNLDL